MSSKLKFSVGYQLPDLYRISDIVAEYRHDIEEVYFPFQDCSTGRGISITTNGEQQEMEEELAEINSLGIKLNLLLNANCYGGKAISVELENQVKTMIRYLFESIGLHVVTTTSLFIAETVKSNFPDIELRASVNMGIGSISEMKYIKDFFDSYYIDRAINRFHEKIKAMKQWAENNGRKLFLLANSGCLRNCSAHTFHDNLVSHEMGLNEQPNRWNTFQGICWDYYRDGKNYKSFIADSTWIRPEDIDSYSGLVDGIKLATRVHRKPEEVIGSYVQREFSGNTLSLCEPDFSSLCFIDNSSFPTGWIDGFANLDTQEEEKYSEEIFNHVNS